MKKVLSILLVLAMLALPVSVYAAGDGSGANPYKLVNNGAAITITIPSETSVYLQADNTNGSTVNVVSASHTSYFFWYCRQTFNSASTLAMNPGVDMITLENTGSSDLTISLTLTGGSDTEIFGTQDNPLSFEFTPNFFGNLAANLTADLEANNEGYYFTCLAPDDGVISVDMPMSYDADFNDLGWSYSVSNISSGVYSNINYSDAAEEDLVTYETVKVSKNDEIVIFASTYNPSKPNNNPAGTISVSVSFAPMGSYTAPEETTMGTHATSLEAQNDGYHYYWMASAPGTVTFTMNATSNWQYSVGVERTDDSVSMSDTHYCDDDEIIREESLAVNTGDEIKIWVATYNPTGGISPEGTISWTLSFVDGEGNVSGGGNEGEGGDLGEDPEANYYLSDTAIQMGTAAYPYSAIYRYTAYEFIPEETGRYTFTSTDGNIALVSNNGMWITVGAYTTAIEDGIVTENTFSWDCTSVGQTIWVAAESLSDSSATVEISVTREDIVIKEYEKRPYENTTTPEAFTFTGDASALLYVDTLDEKCDTAVLGDDGYYHLNAANGPILLVDLNDDIMNLADAYDLGQLRATVYEGDEAQYIIDYTAAFGAYYECADEETGLYPLTADLMTIYQTVGADKGKNWYGENGMIGGLLDDAWMFACYYLEGAANIEDLGTETPNNTNTNTNTNTNNTNNATENKSPLSSGATGDNVVMIIIIAAVAVAGVVALIVFRKKAKAN